MQPREVPSAAYDCGCGMPESGAGGPDSSAATELLARAAREPINIDISSFSDEWCEGFLAGQESILEEIVAGRLEVPRADA